MAAFGDASAAARSCSRASRALFGTGGFVPGVRPVLPPVLPPAVAKRTKRSVSLSPELAVAIQRAAEEAGETFSGWLAETASHRLRIEAGKRGLAAWEHVHGALTAEELDDGRSRARALLARGRTRRTRKTA
jgi:hypothetical protein